jgi:S1-C subfamily serine protease
MPFGGMRLVELSDEERRQAGLPQGALGLRVFYVGQFGDHALAKKAGIVKDDIVVAFDGLTGRLSESQLVAHAVQRKRPGDVVSITFLRGGERKTVSIAMQ